MLPAEFYEALAERLDGLRRETEFAGHVDPPRQVAADPVAQFGRPARIPDHQIGALTSRQRAAIAEPERARGIAR